MTDPARLRGALLRWYRKGKRDLPWRRTADPYAVLVSEVMLQQTTVATAIPRWERFLTRFPTVEALAAASERDVEAEWSGLGYYARARNLVRAAREVVRRGSFPRSAGELRALPGVGPYTAAAVASIAFGEEVASIDGNVVRVLSRLLASRVDPRRGARSPRLVSLASRLVAGGAAGERNQALMELGATVCLPHRPACWRCPVRLACRAAALGRPESFPAPAPRRQPRRLRLACGVARRGGKLVLVPDRILVRGHLSLPAVEVAVGADPAADLAHGWRSLAGRSADGVRRLGSVRHAVLERRYEVQLFEVSEAPRASRRVAGLRLVDATALDRVPHGGLLAKALALARGAGSPRRARG